MTQVPAAGSWWRRVLSGALVLAALSMLPAAAANVAAPAASQHITTSYGYALYGDLKYPANFKHFNYVNPDAPKGGTVHLVEYGTYNSFNTFALRGTSGINFLDFFMYYNSLMRGAGDATAQSYCLLCETISYPDDFSWVEFRLRKSACWHDGKPITADDVVFSFDMLKNHAAPAWANSLVHIVKAVKTGPMTVRFYADVPNNRRLPLGIAGMLVIPKHYWQGRDFTAPVSEPPLSSGPYEVSSFEIGRSYTFKRVKDYWGKDLPVNRGQNNYGNIVFDYYRDTVAEFEAFKAGYTDVRLEISPCKWLSGYTWPAVKHNEVVKSTINMKGTPTYAGFFYNMRLPKFQDPALRNALRYAFDFTWINKNLSCGAGVPSNSLFGNTELAAKGLPTPQELALLEPYRSKVPPQVFTTPYQTPLTDGTEASLRSNLRKAAQILQRAGYVMKDGKLVSPKTGKPVEFNMLLWDPNLERPANNWSTNLKLLGITTSMRTVDYPTFTKRMESFDFDVAFQRIPFGSPPGNELRNLFNSSYANVSGSANLGGIKDPVIDALVEKVLSAKTKPEMLTAAHALDRVVMWNNYTMPLGADADLYNVAYWNRLGRPEKQPNAGYSYLNLWWVDPQKDAQLRAERGTTN